MIVNPVLTSTVKSKQEKLNEFTHNLFQPNRPNIQTPDAKTLLKEIFNLDTDDTHSPYINDINELRETRGILNDWFGYNKKIVRSAVNAAVIVFLKSLHTFKEGFSIRSGYLIDTNKFYTFLVKQLGKKTACELLQEIPENYLDEIKLVPTLSMIVFGSDYVIDTSIIKKEDHTAPAGITKKIRECEEEIKNKHIRDTYTDTEIIHAKTLAENYFNETIIPKINQITKVEEKEATISQLICLNRMINVAARNLSTYAVEYEVLQELASDIFKKLEIDRSEDKIHFINSLFFVNFHRNCGITAKRILKVPVMLIWCSLPFIALTGMIIAGVSALNVLGLALGVFGIIGALIEGGSDLLNYSSYNQKLNKFINCGDKIASSTDTSLRLENDLLNIISTAPGNKKRLRIENAIPNNADLQEEFCSIKYTLDLDPVDDRNTIRLNQLENGESANNTASVRATRIKRLNQIKE